MKDIPFEPLGIFTLVHIEKKSEMKDYSISVDQDRYASSIVTE